MNFVSVLKKKSPVFTEKEKWWTQSRSRRHSEEHTPRLMVLNPRRAVR